MKDVCFKFYGLGYNEYYQANVSIYDLYGNLVYSGNTYNSILNTCLNIGEKYLVKATFMGEVIIRYIIINRPVYIFIFDHALMNEPAITFILKDYYYNLPIERGELILYGQNN